MAGVRMDLVRAGFVRLRRRRAETSCLRSMLRAAGWVDAPRFDVSRRLAARIAWGASLAPCNGREFIGTRLFGGLGMLNP